MKEMGGGGCGWKWEEFVSRNCVLELSKRSPRILHGLIIVSMKVFPLFFSPFFTSFIFSTGIVEHWWKKRCSSRSRLRGRIRYKFEANCASRYLDSIRKIAGEIKISRKNKIPSIFFWTLVYSNFFSSIEFFPSPTKFLLFFTFQFF